MENKAKFLLLISLILALFVSHKLDWKLKIANQTLEFVNQHESEISHEAIISSKGFQKLTEHLKQLEQPGAIVFLNNHYINITFNWLCNTKYYAGIHKRVVAVTLDSGANMLMSQVWPGIFQFHWPLSAIHSAVLGRQTVHYVLLFRANLARALAERGLAFWMFQQDTIWRENFLLHESQLFSQPVDFLFDLNGHDLGENGTNGMGCKWDEKKSICGSNWFVNCTENSVIFLKSLSDRMKSWYSPDSTIASYQCQRNDPVMIDCQYLPFRLSSSWSWFTGDMSNPPIMIQIDSQDHTEKLDHIRHIGFDFVSLHDRTSCNRTAVDQVKEIFENGSLKSHSLVTYNQWYLQMVDILPNYIGNAFPVLRPYFNLLYFFADD